MVFYTITWRKSTKKDLRKIPEGDVLEILRQGAAMSTPEETLQLVADVTEFKEHLMKDETFDDRWANVGELAKASARVSQPGIDMCC
jgi:DNA-binding ferritin-like protein (Dps family)